MIQGTILVVVDEDVGVGVATLAMMTMVEAGAVVAVATVEAGQITLAVVEVDGAQAAVVAPPRVLVVMAEALGVGMLLDGGVELAVITTVVEAAGEQRLVVQTVLVVEVEGAGEKLLVALTTQDGTALKKP